MLNKFFIFCTAVAIAGCGEKPMEITKAPVEVNRTAGFVTENYVGDDQAYVRSYFPKDKEAEIDRAEFAGAACKLKGRGFTASFQTPAIVNLPDYDYYSQPVTGSCSVDGVVRPVVLKPYNETSRSRNAAVSGGASQGGLLGMAIAGIAVGIAEAANDPTNDDWDYNNVDVEFPNSLRPSGPQS